MKTELTYLLEELDKWSSSALIRVDDLKKMIERSFEKAAEDQKAIEDSMSAIGHDMP